MIIKRRNNGGTQWTLERVSQDGVSTRKASKVPQKLEPVSVSSVNEWYPEALLDAEHGTILIEPQGTITVQFDKQFTVTQIGFR